jgi:hypothetical protein
MTHNTLAQEMTRDDYIAMKMLTRYKELRREQPSKPQPDLGWMLDLLEVSRTVHEELINKSSKKTTVKTSEQLFEESKRICGDCFDPIHARAWADALAKP